MQRKLVISATDFKAKCLHLLDEAETKGTVVTVTRRGKPVGILSPAPAEAWKSPQDQWAKKARITSDIVNTNHATLWDIAAKS